MPGLPRRHPMVNPSGRMDDLGRAIDLYVGELARGGCTPETLRTYRRILDLFADRYEAKAVASITANDCRSFLDRWATAKPPTLAQYVSILRGFFAFLYEEGAIAETPMARIKRPRRPAPEDTEVVTISTGEALRILEACEDWQEVLCVATALYSGARRGALSKVRRRDLDLEAGTIRFLEKGRKVVTKPVPDEYLAILRAAEADGIWTSRRTTSSRIVAQRPYADANARTRSFGRRSVGLRRGLESALTCMPSARPSPSSTTTHTPNGFSTSRNSWVTPVWRQRSSTCAAATRRAGWRRCETCPGRPPCYHRKHRRRIRDSNPCYRRERAAS